MTKAFVIGPIGDKFAPIGSKGREAYEDALEVFEHVVRPACVANDLEPVRADGIAKSGEITDQIFRHLSQDPVVIADVTGGNPNVMYELGLRHTRNLLTIQIGEYGQLPFDVSAIRTIMFSRSDRGLIDARKALDEALAVGLAEGGDPVSATRVWLSLPKSGVQSDEAVAIEDDWDEAGFLDQLKDIEQRFPAMTQRMVDIGDVLTRMGSDAERAGEDVQLINAGDASATARLNAVRTFAEALKPHADELTGHTNAFADDMKATDASVRGILSFIRENPDQIDDARPFLSSLTELAQSAREGMEGVNEFGGIVLGLGRISKILRRPAGQISAAVNTMARATALIDEWSAEAETLSRVAANADADPLTEGK